MFSKIKFQNRSIINDKEEEMASLNEHLISLSIQNERIVNENSLLKGDLSKFRAAFRNEDQWILLEIYHKLIHI